MEIRPDPKKGGHDVLLGKYEIGRLLGRGTFAKVYHARSVADETTVAVKVLDKKELAAARMAPLILREVDAMSRLSHPNILRLHEVMATKTKIYLVMEYAPGGELLTRLTRRLPEQTARRYFNQLLSALRFCHARGVAHRDVKPQNLLLDGQGLLKVSDFGLSALPDNLRDGRLHTSCGTPAYAAPEVLQGKPYDGTRADAWSCGVILYVLLAGKLPFDDSNLALMFRKIIKREYEFPPWFPQPAKRVVARLLDPNPETRLTLEKLTELPWLKRSYSLDNQLNLMESGPRLDRSLTVPMMNAFDIISMSPPDSSPQLQSTLRTLLYKDGVFRIDRLESLLTESLRAQPEPSVVRKQVANTDSSTVVKQVLSFALNEKSAFVREIILQEFAKGIDALGLATLDSVTSAAASGLPFAFSYSSSTMSVEDIANLRTLRRLLLLPSRLQKNEVSNTDVEANKLVHTEEASLILHQLTSVQNFFPVLAVIPELPPESQQQLFQLPADLAGRLLSRIAARVIRRLLT